MQNITIAIVIMVAELLVFGLAGILFLIGRRRDAKNAAEHEEASLQENNLLAQRLTEVHDLMMNSRADLFSAKAGGVETEVRRCVGQMRRAAALLGTGDASAAQVGHHLLDSQEALLTAFVEHVRASRNSVITSEMLPRKAAVMENEAFVAPGPEAKPGLLVDRSLKAELQALHKLVSLGETKSPIHLSPPNMMEAKIETPLELFSVVENTADSIVASKKMTAAEIAELHKLVMPADGSSDYVIPSRKMTEDEIEALMQADLESMENQISNQPPTPDQFSSSETVIPLSEELPELQDTEDSFGISSEDASGPMLQDEIDALLGLADHESSSQVAPMESDSLLQNEIDALLGASRIESAPQPSPAPMDNDSLLQNEIDALLGASRIESAPQPSPAPMESDSLLQNEIDALLGSSRIESAPLPSPAPMESDSLLQNEIDALLGASKIESAPQPSPAPMANNESLLQNEIDVLLGSASLKKAPRPAPATVESLLQNEIDALLESVIKESAPRPTQASSDSILQDEIDALMRSRDEENTPHATLSSTEPLLQDEIDSLMMAPRLPVTPPEPLAIDHGVIRQDELDALMNSMMAAAAEKEKERKAEKKHAGVAKASVPFGVTTPSVSAKGAEMDLQSEIDALFSSGALPS